MLADLGHLEPATPLALIGLVGPPLAGLNLATGFNETSLSLANTWTAWSLVLIASLVYYTVFLTPAGLIVLTAKRAAASSSTHSLWWGWQGVHLAAHAVLSVYAIRIFLG